RSRTPSTPPAARPRRPARAAAPAPSPRRSARSEPPMTDTDIPSVPAEDAPAADSDTSMLEREGDIAADYLEELLDIADIDGDIDIDVDQDRKSTRLNSSHVKISYAVFCLK